MFTYFHGYYPGLFTQYDKSGLLNKNSGVRFCQSIDIDESLKFNNLAAKGGELYNLVKYNNLPFYIDRLQGGCFIEKYPYDKELIKEYKNFLNDKFFGFQMHEWSGNYFSDIKRIEACGCTEWTKDAIQKALLGKFKFNHIYLESMSADEIASFKKAENHKEYIKVLEWLFEDRQKYADGDLLTCNSSFQPLNLEFKRGLKRTMPEIGAQTPDARFQLAYARGMSKAYGAQFGAYYEPWGGSPFSTCCYHRNGKNEWNIENESFPFSAMGENGGSSRSLQERLHMYAYFAGAQFISEEWGVCNTFYDWNDFELTPYGKVKRDFIKFTEKYSDIGTPVTPIAVVLPENLLIFDSLHTKENTYIGFDLENPRAKEINNIRKVLHKLFCESGEMSGNETMTLLNCTLPDVIDVVHADKFNYNDYEYFVDLSGCSEFSNKYASKICKPDDLPAILDKILPFTAHGNAMKQLTKLSDGSYYLLLSNNSGVERSVGGGEKFLQDANSVVNITLKNGYSFVKKEGEGSLHLNNDNTYTINIPAGKWILCHIGKGI